MRAAVPGWKYLRVAGCIILFAVAALWPSGAAYAQAVPKHLIPLTVDLYKCLATHQISSAPLGPALANRYRREFSRLKQDPGNVGYRCACYTSKSMTDGSIQNEGDNVQKRRQ